MTLVPQDNLDDPQPLPEGRLRGRVAVITGASSGIGRAIAFRFSREGAKIVCADLQPDCESIGSRLQDSGFRTDEYIRRQGGDATFAIVDVSNASLMCELIAKTVEKHGRLDIMVNNAGICPESLPDHFGKRIHECDENVFYNTMMVNCWGVFLGCKYAVRQFLNQEPRASGDRGWIINVGSTASFVASGPVAYNTSKGATLQCTRSVAVEMASERIHCNILCPGDATTPCYKPHIDSETAVAESIKSYPWGRFATLKELAGAAFFLASDDAGYVTGAALAADGGFTAQ
ncbi:hypothetical protein PENSTE_c031G07787 [Penicillium steckii]|uniref:Uncharacterized protein n=1 Tax=Penicillium steckii TaxID=303698 RepID=A0A1V6SM43_9EURO|nr:hypothetical protein PENSTE_c031G07787 [Penicillium steckii]